VSRPCSVCGKELKGHRTTHCEACYARDYRERNKAKTRAAQQAWYAINRDRVLAQRKAWNARNAEKMKARRAARNIETAHQALVRVPVKGWGCI
jgi:hypothetical protein